MHWLGDTAIGRGGPDALGTFGDNQAPHSRTCTECMDFYLLNRFFDLFVMRSVAMT